MAGDEKREKVPLRTRLTSPRAMMLVAWGSLVATVPALISAIVFAAINHDWPSIAPIAFAVGVAVVVLWLLRGHAPKSPPRTTVFRPFAKLDARSAWHRPDDTEKVVQAILDKDETLPLVVGSSGVGKSTLLDVLVREKIERDPRRISYHVISEGYTALLSQLVVLFADRNNADHTVIVLDQFERWLAYVRLLPFGDRRDEHQSVREKLREIHDSPNCTLVLSVRREWYYDLRFLEDLVPSPMGACEIQGPAASESLDPMRAQILASFKAITEPDVAEEILERLGAGGTTGRISPLEAQIVGAVLETQARRGREIDVEYFDKAIGGVRGAIDTFFDTILAGAQRPDVCLKVLCALSMKARFREQTELHNILASVFEEGGIVIAAVNYLTDRKLVVQDGPSRYDLAHDFLAETFSSKSGGEMNPIERDNIAVYVGTGGRRNADVLEDERVTMKRHRLGRIVVSALLLVMAAHVILANIDLAPAGPSLERPVIGPSLDASYLLIFVPYAAWIVYIGLFYDRFLIHLKETRVGRTLSILIVLNLIISVAISIVIPFAWILAIATGGLVFAAKIMWISRRPTMNRAARDRLSYFGSRALLNLMIVAALGAAATYFSFTNVDPGQDVTYWMYLNLVASVMITYWCLALAPTHVTRGGMSQLLGLAGRPGPVAIA